MLVPVFIQPQPFEKRPRFFTRFLRRLRVQKQLFGNAGGKELRTGVVAAIVDVFAQLGCSGFLSVQEYLSAGFPRKAGKQQGKRRLSRAVSPANCRHRSSWKCAGEVRKNRGPAMSFGQSSCLQGHFFFCIVWLSLCRRRHSCPAKPHAPALVLRQRRKLLRRVFPHDPSVF